MPLCERLHSERPVVTALETLPTIAPRVTLPRTKTGVDRLNKPLGPPDLLSVDHIECPYHLYQRLHLGSGVALDPAIGVVVAGYEDLVVLAKSTALFSSSISEDGKGPHHMGVGSDPVQPDVEEVLARAHPVENALFTADSPEHTRHRKLINKALSPRRVRDLESGIRQLANQLVDAFIDTGELDLLKQFAVPLPVTVIADILGVDRADIATFKHWGDLMISGNVEPRVQT